MLWSRYEANDREPVEVLFQDLHLVQLAFRPCRIYASAEIMGVKGHDEAEQQHGKQVIDQFVGREPMHEAVQGERVRGLGCGKRNHEIVHDNEYNDTVDESATKPTCAQPTQTAGRRYIYCSDEQRHAPLQEKTEQGAARAVEKGRLAQYAAGYGMQDDHGVEPVDQRGCADIDGTSDEPGRHDSLESQITGQLHGEHLGGMR